MLRAAALGLLVLATAVCCRSPAPEPRARNLILVTIDTLRADRLGAYGNPDVATPHLDRIAGEGALFPEAAVAVPLTRPSHATILTGLDPADHGLRDNVSPPLAAGIPTLATILKRAGFETAGFISAVVLSSQSGLNRGFDHYSDRFELGADDARFLNSIQKRGDGPSGEAVAWLEARRGGRFFAWLHLYDPHDPYEPPEPYAARYPGRPYDGEVAYSDALVGRVLAALDRLGRRDDTLVVVTSDHGEGLGEHGENAHGFFVYQSTLRVPLLLRGPGIPPGARPSVTARSVDLLPTVLELLGVGPAGERALPGRSLVPAWHGKTIGEEPSYAESLLPLLHYGWSDLRSLREGRWKYIQAPRAELYDLLRDPREHENLAQAQPARAEAMRAALARRLTSETQAGGEGSAGVPPDLLEKLGALGYLGAGAPPAGSATGADPKDKIDEYKVLNRLVREGLLSLREKDHRRSVERFRELLRRGISSFEVHYYLARGLVGLGRPREAVPHFEKALERLPGFAAAWLALAESQLALGDAAAALATLQKGAGACSRDPRILEREAQLLRAARRGPEARRAYEKAAALAPKDALLKVQLAEVCRDLGDLESAARARGRRARPRARLLLELARHGARGKRRAARGGEGVPRGPRSRRDERPVLLQSRSRAAPAGKARGRGDVLPPLARATTRLPCAARTPRRAARPLGSSRGDSEPQLRPQHQSPRVDEIRGDAEGVGRPQARADPIVRVVIEEVQRVGQERQTDSPAEAEVLLEPDIQQAPVADPSAAVDRLRQDHAGAVDQVLGELDGA
jgi:arylsulfatase A-like enzyme